MEVSILESLLDFQFELLTTYFQTKRQPERSALANGQPLLSAPYGIYRPLDGYLAPVPYTHLTLPKDFSL